MEHSSFLWCLSFFITIEIFFGRFSFFLFFFQNHLIFIFSFLTLEFIYIFALLFPGFILFIYLSLFFRGGEKLIFFF